MRKFSFIETKKQPIREFKRKIMQNKQRIKILYLLFGQHYTGLVSYIYIYVNKYNSEEFNGLFLLFPLKNNNII